MIKEKKRRNSGRIDVATEARKKVGNDWTFGNQYVYILRVLFSTLKIYRAGARFSLGSLEKIEMVTAKKDAWPMDLARNEAKMSTPGGLCERRWRVVKLRQKLLKKKHKWSGTVLCFVTCSPVAC